MIIARQKSAEVAITEYLATIRSDYALKAAHERTCRHFVFGPVGHSGTGAFA
jgi:hypothetical protein